MEPQSCCSLGGWLSAYTWEPQLGASAVLAKVLKLMLSSPEKRWTVGGLESNDLGLS